MSHPCSKSTHSPGPGSKKQSFPLQLNSGLTIIECVLSTEFIEFYFTAVLSLFAVYLLYSCALLYRMCLYVWYRGTTCGINLVLCCETSALLMHCLWRSEGVSLLAHLQWPDTAQAVQPQLLQLMHSSVIRAKTSCGPSSPFWVIFL